MEFYSEECSVCRKFAPVWEEFATKAKTEVPEVVVAKVFPLASLEVLIAELVGG